MTPFNVLLVALSFGLSARAQSYSGMCENHGSQKRLFITLLGFARSYVFALGRSKPQVRRIPLYLRYVFSYCVVSAKRVRLVPTSAARQLIKHLCARMRIVSHQPLSIVYASRVPLFSELFGRLLLLNYLSPIYRLMQAFSKLKFLGA
jgi:hypothetical protein